MKKRNRKGALIISCFACVLAVTSACASSNSGNKEQAGGPKGTLIIDDSFQVTTVDPARAFSELAFMVDHVTYQTLVSFDGSDVTKPVPLVAQSFSPSSDYKTYTFKLRHDIKFADGTPLTAKDVVYSLNRVANIKGNPSFLMDGLTVTSQGDYSVTIKSKVPIPQLPAILATPALAIVNSKQVAAHGGNDTPQASTQDKAQAYLESTSAGSGPYKLVSFSTTTQIVLEANPDYWGTPKPAYSKIVIRNTQAPEQLLNIQAGSSQVALDLSPQQAAQIPAGKNLNIVSGPSSNVFFLFMNNDPKISTTTSNKKIQEAVRYGIDYNALVNLAGKGAAKAEGIIPSTFAGALPPGAGPAYDPTRAKAAVQSSGLENPTVTLRTYSDSQVNGLSFVSVSTLIQSDLEKIGLTVHLEPQTSNVLQAAYDAGTVSMAVVYWGPDYPDPADYLNFLPGTSLTQRYGWPAGSKPSVTALGNQAMNTFDAAKRTVLYEKIQKNLNEESPEVPLVQTAMVLVSSKALQGVTSNPMWGTDLATITG